MRWFVVAVGALGVLFISGGIAASYGGYPGYSPLRQFISELALPINPHAARLSAGFIAGGACAALFLAAVAVATRGAMRWSAGIGAAAATCLILVGVYPITRPDPHVAAAAGAILAATVASVLFARARPSRPVRILVIFQLAVLGAVLAYATYVIAGTEVSASSVLIGRAVRLGDTNPIAMAEWIYVADVLSLLSIVVVAATRRGGQSL